MVYSRLSRRLRETGHRSFSDYLGWLAAGHDGAARADEWQQFVNGLTTNLTSFFREAHHFECLAQDLRARRRRAAHLVRRRLHRRRALLDRHGGRRSAGRRSARRDRGQRHRHQGAGHRRRAASTTPTARGLSPSAPAAGTSCAATGANEGRIRVQARRWRGASSFRALNLIDPRWDLGGPFHIVFCRNVMIYFDARHPAPGARAIARCDDARWPAVRGPFGELHRMRASWFRLRGKTVYVKV